MVVFDPLLYARALRTLPSLLPAEDPGRLAAVPFLQVLIESLQPRVYVEVGADLHSTYGAACQALAGQASVVRCFGLPAFEGDQLDPRSQPLINPRQRAAHDASYGAFSQLGQADAEPAEALAATVPAIDLLLIDARRTYQAVAYDLARFRPLLSPRGVVLLFGIAEPSTVLGARRLWQKLAAQQPHFELPHSLGLGLLAGFGTGDLADLPASIQALCTADDATTAGLRTLFESLGERLVMERDVLLARREIATQVPLLQAAHVAAHQVEHAHSQQRTAWQAEREVLERALAAQKTVEQSLRQQVQALEETLHTLNHCLSFRIGMAATAPLRWMTKRRQPSST